MGIVAVSANDGNCRRRLLFVAVRRVASLDDGEYLILFTGGHLEDRPRWGFRGPLLLLGFIFGPILVPVLPKFGKMVPKLVQK